MKLREVLDRDGITRGSDKGIKVIQGRCEMMVSRRYLECEPWKNLLDTEVIQNDVKGIYVIKNI